jgi:hypothetical protein
MVDVVDVVGMCAPGQTVAQVTLSDVVVVLSVNVCTNGWFEIFCHLLAGTRKS